MLAICQRCRTAYTIERSHSSLRLTYCGVLCERADLGFVINALLEFAARPASATEQGQVRLAAQVPARDKEVSR